LPAALAPGEIISIFGQGVGSAADGKSTQLLLNGAPAAPIYASSSQVNAVVPNDAAVSGVAKVKVTVSGALSPEWGIPLASAAPGIFTLDGSGAGQAAVLNQDSSVNGAGNPAARGSVIQIFGTGVPPANLPVKVAIGGFDAAVQYQGPAPGLISGVSQVNALVPAAVTPGAAVPLVIRTPDRTSQSFATVAVR
jgi:uncharacterized protein (TIGR03437 family)